MKTITVNVDNSSKLQKLIDTTGNVPAKYVFETQEIEINSKIRLYNFTEWDAQDCLFTLKENIPTSIFGNGIPLIAPKNPTAAEGLCLHDFKFDGNRDTQNGVPPRNGKRWGLGYHNVIMLGALNNVSYSNSKNCEFYNIDYKNSLGDLLRVEGGSNISAHDITAKRGGHDVVCFVVNGGEIYNVRVDMAVNAGVRTRSAKNVKIHDCELNGGTGEAYSPGIEIQSTAKNWISENIEIYNNYIHDTYGPGIQVIGSVANNGIVNIHNNLLVACGAMPASVNRPVVGGIVWDGYPVEICNNTIVNCYGYGVVAGDYDATSTQSASGNIKRNIITGTKPALKSGAVYSGTGIANLTGTRNSVICAENCQYGNKTANHYKVTNKSVYNCDPCFVSSSDFHLKSRGGHYTQLGFVKDEISSPCIFPDYELGAFAETIFASIYCPPAYPTVTISRPSEDALKALVTALRAVGYLEQDEKVEFANVSDDFTA